MTLETAKNNIKKAVKNMNFAKRVGLPFTNHADIAYNKAKPKLASMEASMKLDTWYSEYVQKNLIK